MQTFCSELYFSLMQFEDGCIVPNFITLNSVQISPLSWLGGAGMVRWCWWNIKTDFFWLMSQAEALLWNNCSSNPTEQWINTALKLPMIIRCRNRAFDLKAFILKKMGDDVTTWGLMFESCIWTKVWHRPFSTRKNGQLLFDHFLTSMWVLSPDPPFTGLFTAFHSHSCLLLPDWMIPGSRACKHRFVNMGVVREEDATSNCVFNSTLNWRYAYFDTSEMYHTGIWGPGVFADVFSI